MKAAATALAEAATGHSPRPAAAERIAEADAGSARRDVVEDADSSASQPPPPRGRGAGVAARFVLRYALIGLAGYAIFVSSLVSLGAFFLGLFLFIAAILAEVAYQIYGAFRRA